MNHYILLFQLHLFLKIQIKSKFLTTGKVLYDLSPAY